MTRIWIEKWTNEDWLHCAELENVLIMGTHPANEIVIEPGEAGDVGPFCAQLMKATSPDGRVLVLDVGGGGISREGNPLIRDTLGDGDVFRLGQRGPTYRVRSTAAQHSASGPAQPALGDVTLMVLDRIQVGSVTPTELDHLLGDQQRIQRVVAAGGLEQSQVQLLQTAVQVERSRLRLGSRRRWVLLSLAVLASLLLLYELMSHRYASRERQLLDDIRALETQLGSASLSLQKKEAVVGKLQRIEQELRALGKQGGEDFVYATPLGFQVQAALEEFGASSFPVPQPFIDRVDYYLKSLPRGEKSRADLRIAFKNKLRYQRLIETGLQDAGLSKAFLYLAMHESLLDPLVISETGARGLWQLLPSTAADYGLRVPRDYRSRPAAEDERTDPILSTRSATQHIRNLYAELGDTLLAIVAYNAGQGTIRSALKQLEDPVHQRDFWFVYRMEILSNEASEYVPKIIATMLIDLNRKEYGFEE